MSIREAPQPNYNDDIQLLVKEYELAIKRLEKEMNTLFINDFQRAQILITQKNIEAILEELNTGVTTWTSTFMPSAVTEGIATTLFSLSLVESMKDARKMVQFSEINDLLVRAIVADTQDDLLQVTNNVSRKLRNAIRKGTGKSMRANLTQGINGTQALKRDVLKEWKKDLGDALGTGIIDKAGRRWKPATYAEMVVRTKMLNAHIEATTNEALENGVQYAIVSSHNAPNACRFHEGRIVKLDPNAPGDYPTIEELRNSGQIFHPNCKHVITPIRSLDELSEKRKKRTEEQAELGKRALAIGGRNPLVS
ncbi:phage minor capsid protein [Paenisporosarcina sp. NPDC076898]|uniref:phage minor capsid protein n=1 Tax=unclassified Paenisporosarcina TaxID=2642018 RepID=UPI003D0302F5